MRISLLRYGVAAASVAAAAWGAGFFLPPDARLSLWMGAGLGLGVQAVCYAVLLQAVRSPGGFLGAWAAGVLVRLAALAAFGFWGTAAAGLKEAPALLGMAAVLFALLLLEPLGLPRPAEAVRA